MRFRARALLLLLSGFVLAGGCSSDPNQPAKGPPFFTATLNGVAWSPQFSQAYCTNDDIQLSAQRTFGTPDSTEALFLTLSNLARLGQISLTDSLSGRFALFGEFYPGGSSGSVFFHTTPGGPGRLTLTGLNLQDSLVAGSFDFTVVADSNASLTRTFTGSFRAALAPVYTPQFPDGTPCTVPH